MTDGGADLAFLGGVTAAFAGWRRVLLAAVLVTLAAGALAQRPPLGQPWLARVSYVVDGDSIWVRPEAGGARVRLRLDGIDAPEVCQPFGPEARRALKAALLNQRVRVTVWAYDGYRRPVASVVRLPDEADAAAQLVADGWAWSDGFHGRPGKYASQEADARRAGRGLFAERGSETPAAFRRRHGPCNASPR